MTDEAHDAPEQPYAHLRPMAVQHTHPDAEGETGTVWFRHCPVCGSIRWHASAAVPPDKLVIDVKPDVDRSKCGLCAYVEQRMPELFQWVQGVAGQRVADRFGAMLGAGTPPGDGAE